MQRRTILNDARIVFVNILQLQEKKNLQNKQIEISESLLKAVDNKVLAGKLSPAEKSRAKIQLFQEQTALREIEASLKIAWNTLSTFWENENVKYDFALGDITMYSSFSKKFNLTNSPDIHLSELMIEIQKATLQLEKANAIPNFDLDAGLSGGSQDKTYYLGLSIPLPLFNRNKGNILSAKIMQLQKQFAQNALQTKLKTKISNIHIELEELYTEINLLLNEIIPEANSAFAIIQDGYINGRFTYLDVVDMKGIWFQSQEQYLSALNDYHISFLELNSILGINKTTLFGDN